MNKQQMIDFAIAVSLAAESGKSIRWHLMDKYPLHVCDLILANINAKYN